MPALSTDLETKCPEPILKVGQNVYSALGRTRVWGKCEQKKHMDTVNAYNRVRKTRPTKRN